MQRRTILWAAISGMVAVILGAMGAHKLLPLMEADKAHAFTTGSLYHLVHSVVLLVLAALMTLKNNRTMQWAVRLFQAGMLLFSGSLYLISILSIFNIHVFWLGPLTPLGGVCLIAGWLVLFLAFLSGESKSG